MSKELGFPHFASRTVLLLSYKVFFLFLWIGLGSDKTSPKVSPANLRIDNFCGPLDFLSVSRPPLPFYELKFSLFMTNFHRIPCHLF